MRCSLLRLRAMYASLARRLVKSSMKKTPCGYFSLSRFLSSLRLPMTRALTRRLTNLMMTGWGCSSSSVAPSSALFPSCAGLFLVRGSRWATSSSSSCSWTGFLLLEGSELMHTSSLVAYHITSFMLYESSYTDVRFGTD